MKNITVSVDEATYRRARIAAAERNTSVSRLVREYLQSIGSSTDREAARAATLLDALDDVNSFRAGDRIGREDAHER